MDKYQQLLSNVVERNNLPTLSYKPGDILFHQGVIEPRLFWIKSGLVKLVFIQPDGKEFVKAFLAENDISGSLMSVIFEKPSPYACYCIEPCEVIAMPYSKVRERSEKTPQLKDVELEYMQQLTARKEEREYQFLCLTPEERYKSFKSGYPHIFKRISQAELALFLGITPVALSRIKTRLKATA